MNKYSKVKSKHSAIFFLFNLIVNLVLVVLIILSGIGIFAAGYFFNKEEINVTVISASIAMIVFMYTISKSFAVEFDEWIITKRFLKNRLKVRVLEADDSKINAFLHKCREEKKEVTNIKPFTSNKVMVEYLEPVQKK